MTQTHITDDIEKLLELLPISVQNALASEESKENLLEVILDLGRYPEARYPNKVKSLNKNSLTRNDLKEIIQNLGNFGADNRAGIERTLHRISAIKNRKNEIIGLTCRIGRAVFGTVEIIRDLIESEQSLLLMGRPGVGKTTALREITRVIADDLKRRVVVIDTSNEIAGDGDIPHPAIGGARRMQVSHPDQQHQVMIEAVENHMPEVIVIDEIGTELETKAARTIAERGVQLIATAHGNSIENLIKNPTLCDLLGGIKSVTLGDEEARRRRTQKTVLERASFPTFSIAIEMNEREKWLIHKDVAKTVDLMLRGDKNSAEERRINDNITQIKSIGKDPKEDKLLEIKRLKVGFDKNNLEINKIKNSISKDQISEDKNINFCLDILSWGVSYNLMQEAINKQKLPIKIVENIEKADVLISIRNSLSQNQTLRDQAKKHKIPIHVIKSNNFHQIEKALVRLLKKHQENQSAFHL